MAGRHNQRVKLLRRLGRRKYREEEGLFLVEGLRFVEEALSSNWRVELVACTEKATVSPRGKALLQAAEAALLPVMEVDEKLLAELADTKTPQGVLAVVRQKQVRLCDFLSPGKIPLLLVVDGVQDPGNLGAIIRTADAAGAGGVLLLKGTVDLYNPKTLRSTMGSVFHLPVMQGLEPEQVSEFLAGAGIRLFAGQPRAEKSLYEVNMKKPCAFLLGSEGQGPGGVAAGGAENVSIPMPGRAESLNVAAAAAVLLYEALRQRGLRD